MRILFIGEACIHDPGELADVRPGRLSGQGHEVLAILVNILELPATTINIGTAQEMVVWPYLAHEPLDKLSPEQSVDLYRLMTAQDVRACSRGGGWLSL